MQSGVIATVEVKSGAYLQASTNSALQPSPSGLTYPFGRLLHLEPDTVQFGEIRDAVEGLRGTLSAWCDGRPQEASSLGAAQLHWA